MAIEPPAITLLQLSQAIKFVQGVVSIIYTSVLEPSSLLSIPFIVAPHSGQSAESIIHGPALMEYIFARIGVYQLVGRCAW